MVSAAGEIRRIWLEPGGTAGEVACPAAARPAAGQYLLASAPGEDAAPLPAALFPAGVGEEGLIVAPPLPAGWAPGTALELRGPLGRGFALPAAARAVALAALGESIARLLPLARQALERGAAVTLFCPPELLQDGGGGLALPLAVEAAPLDDLPGAFGWADFLALDLPAAGLARLRGALGLDAAARLPCPAQALLIMPMPCAGLAECGVCAVPARRGYRLACKHGPVFDLDELDW